MYATEEFSQIISCEAGAFDVHQEGIISSKAEGLYETARQ
jgi:hypothetical protein